MASIFEFYVDAEETDKRPAFQERITIISHYSADDSDDRMAEESDWGAAISKMFDPCFVQTAEEYEKKGE